MKRKVITACFIIVCFLLQSTVFSVLQFASIRPNLMIILTSAFGFMRGRGEYDGKFFPSEKEFKEFAASAKSPVFVALRERDLGRLSGAGVSFDAVLRNLDMVLVRVKK